jgi:hypothetical protein
VLYLISWLKNDIKIKHLELKMATIQEIRDIIEEKSFLVNGLKPLMTKDEIYEVYKEVTYSREWDNFYTVTRNLKEGRPNEDLGSFIAVYNNIMYGEQAPYSQEPLYLDYTSEERNLIIKYKIHLEREDIWMLKCMTEKNILAFKNIRDSRNEGSPYYFSDFKLFYYITYYQLLDEKYMNAEFLSRIKTIYEFYRKESSIKSKLINCIKLAKLSKIFDFLVVDTNKYYEVFYYIFEKKLNLYEYVKTMRYISSCQKYDNIEVLVKNTRTADEFFYKFLISIGLNADEREKAINNRNILFGISIKNIAKVDDITHIIKNRLHLDGRPFKQLKVFCSWILEKQEQILKFKKAVYLPNGERREFGFVDRLDELELEDILGENVDEKVNLHISNKTAPKISVEKVFERMENRFRLQIEKSILNREKINFDNLEIDVEGATQLKDSHSLIVEGKALNHCVGGYVDNCRNRKSFIFNINESSTVEFDNDFQLVQHRAYRNTEPNISNDMVVDRLLKTLQEKKEELLKKLGEKETISSRVPPRRPIEEINV